MVPVPLFGSARPQNRLGKHAILLDGHNASFALSLGEPNVLLEFSAAWAWSSNVLNSLVIDPVQGRFFSRRWDDPSRIAQSSLPSESAARDLIESFDQSLPARSETAVQRALVAFRTIRTAVSEMGGSDERTMQIFIATLEWLRQSSAESVNLGISAPPSLTELFKPDDLAYLGKSLLLGATSDGYALDTDLLIRHASGDLFQEAHIQINSPRERKLFITGSIQSAATCGVSKHDAYFTPPSLARLLVDECLSEFDRLNNGKSASDILDPACGSGVFLIESAREIHFRQKGGATLRGMDTSPIARLISEYNLACDPDSFGAGVDLEVQKVDSSLSNDWGNPDIIVMNPPFSSWEAMSKDEQASVRELLGDLYHGRADKSVAFIVKALRTLREGAVLATLAPQSFLTSKFASRIREWIIRSGLFHVRLVGLFRGYSYFRGAVIEPCFLIISRPHGHIAALPTTFVLAPDSKADRAIRALRLRGQGFDVPSDPTVHIMSAVLNPERWKPETAASTSIRGRLDATDIPCVRDLFEVQEGIRTGNNKIFILRKWELDRFEIPSDFRNVVFRPVASNATIHAGRLTDALYLFYPYQSDGTPFFDSEDTLAAALPGYYSSVLKQNEGWLVRRKGLPGKWWELTRARPTWQASRVPRLISAVFADTGSVTFDDVGDYVITQGFYWRWRRGQYSENLGLAYMALLNSGVFLALCRSESREMRGGQVDFYPLHISAVHVPDLEAASLPQNLIDELTEQGRAIFNGTSFNLGRINDLAARCYGFGTDEIEPAMTITDKAALERRFGVLARRWKRETAAGGSVSRIMRHPAYVEILQMGADVVPLMIRDLDGRSPGFWFDALEQLTGTEVVIAEHRGYVDKMAEDWITWARQNGIR